MSEVAFKVENISKKYSILHKQRNEDDSLLAAFAGGLKNMFRPGKAHQTREDFWALRDINFEINKGDRVGIIGRNGAGKSTLLKILSRVVKPTTGTITYEGRLASLLEVGTGFHGDLSGRENIYLNGSILGMTKSEIDSKFDEIVAFSEIEAFIDTPVKRYSSGMYVRLAFAVAAHLNSDILILDEVLAVGDASFQKKCLGKMDSLSNEGGRTILFVSHSMQAIQKFCNKGIYLEKGKLIEAGNIENIVNRYLQSGDSTQEAFDLPEPKEITNGYAYKVYIEDTNGNPLLEVPVGESWRARILFRLTKSTPHVIAGFGIVSSLDLAIRTSWSLPENLEAGDYEVAFSNDDLMLTTGIYRLVIGLSTEERPFHYVDDAVSITISDAGDTSKNKRIVNTQSGLILNPMPFKLRKIK